VSGKAHLFVAVVTLTSLTFIMRLVRTRRLRAKYSMLWMSVGLGLSILAASPRLLDRLSRLIGVAYSPTTLFIVALTFLLLIVVHFSWELSRLEERTRILAEEVALLRCEDAREIHLTEVEQTADDLS
jgi:hypothetical protein